MQKAASTVNPHAITLQGVLGRMSAALSAQSSPPRVKVTTIAGLDRMVEGAPEPADTVSANGVEQLFDYTSVAPLIAAVRPRPPSLFPP